MNLVSLIPILSMKCYTTAPDKIIYPRSNPEAYFTKALKREDRGLDINLGIYADEFPHPHLTSHISKFGVGALQVRFHDDKVADASMRRLIRPMDVRRCMFVGFDPVLCLPCFQDQSLHEIA